MKKLNCVVPFLLAGFSLVTAQVGIGISSPNTNAEVDVTSTSKGLLLPRIALVSTNSASPLSAHVAGMTVYNTATNTSVAANPVYPGEYYNDGTQWLRKSTWNDTRMITGGGITDAISLTTADVVAETASTTILSTISFTLDRPSTVEFSADVSTRYTASGSNTTPLSDGAVKLCTLNFQFTTAPSGVSTTAFFGDHSTSYTTALSSAGTATGDVYLNPYGVITLPVGSYVLNLRGTTLSGTAFRIGYGGGTHDMIQIRATPLQ
ncbi:hypothetical protein B0A69_21440 [Chryseobacterium shigense]|uniref:DUF4352 domain-containing protein n=1 Tax=Chryseobacterium shigense TaxID=297244 RepID=A0A1N7IJD3_9FLAO|nr:hypothetical protein [Chryseobacterium shigense]PQA89987.1 hypothetical protein B0A69_21440 [Chryseobacterium shigense]SIS37091.1 hypothetical protein SAMN05421639_10417 [Chryseobacterium shigense]